ncbi:MAG: cytochrome c oxidase subunit II [Spirochaetes bacterium]|nr:cytochrome c oxidase subunit II [Spirochaetota bacterium]
MTNFFLSVFGFISHAQPASSLAPEVKFAADFINGISLVAFILVEGALIYFVFKYRRKKGEANIQTPYITHDTKLEVVWTVLPTIILAVIFYFGVASFVKLRAMPKDAEIIQLTARQWSWEVKYPYCVKNAKTNAERCIKLTSKNVNPTEESIKAHKLQDELMKDQVQFVIAKGHKYVMQMTSTDVIHSFTVPSFYVKQDVVPGLTSRLWFEPTVVGEFVITCNEYCGNKHSGMLGKFKVVEPAEYEQWKTASLAALQKELDQDASGGPVDETALIAKGKELYGAKGCLACHSLNGTPGAGPTYKGLYGHQVELTTGAKVVADDAYLAESMLKPAVKVVKGYAAMPNMGVEEADVKPLIAFIKSLK